MTREELVRIIRDTVTTSDVDNPITFDPPEWALRAVDRAQGIGQGIARISDSEAALAMSGRPGYRVEVKAVPAEPAADRDELRTALAQMLDRFGDYLDKQVLREFRALVEQSR